jgi:signal transduction histidine kinase
MSASYPTILLIDDESHLLVGLSAALMRAGYHTISAASGREGLRLAQSTGPDLILCDIMMPPPDGMELRRLLSLDPKTAAIPFIFLTARDGLTERISGLEAGADDYITKPFDRRELIARVQSALRRNERARQAGRAELEAEMERLRHEISQNFDHELRTPLAVILGSLELAMHKAFAGDQTSLNAFIGQALANAERLRVLIEDLITLNQMDSGDATPPLRQEINPDSDFRRPLTRLLERWAERQPDVRIHVDPAAVIYAPRSGFRQAACHLFDNACKFSPAGTPVEVRLTANGRGGCRLLVTDQGPGIPPELREKVFDRYFQGSQGTARQFGGLGLGLTIARAFARALGGDVCILDTPAGCQVEMTIPPGQLDWRPANG